MPTGRNDAAGPFKFISELMTFIVVKFVLDQIKRGERKQKTPMLGQADDALSDYRVKPSHIMWQIKFVEKRDGLIVNLNHKRTVAS